MNAIQNFAFEEHLVRVIEDDDEPWFVGADVCRALDIKNTPHAISRLDDDERRPDIAISDASGTKYATVISEPGVYRLVFSSRKEEAERFKRWLAHEVLPAIRKTGAYGQPKPETTIERVTLEGEAPLMARVEAVKLASRLWGRDRARSLWSKLGLPSVPPAQIHEGGGEARACLRVLLEHAPNDDRPIRDLIMDAMDGDEEARLLCVASGVKPCDDGQGYMVANVNATLEAIYKGTEWQRRGWRMVLKRLPGSNPTGTQRFHTGGIQSRATWLPIDTLDEGQIS